MHTYHHPIVSPCWVSWHYHKCLLAFSLYTNLVVIISDVEATFVLPLKETAVTEDEDAEFTCELSKPDAMVKWLKNGVELSASDHVNFETVGTKRTLKIHKSVLDDAATYQCQIVSSGASSQAQLTVTGMQLLSSR